MPGRCRALVTLSLPVSLGTAVLLSLAGHGARPAGGTARAAAPSAPASAAPTGTGPAAPTTSSPAPAATASRPESPERHLRSRAVATRRLSAGLAGLFGPGESYSVAGYDLTTGRTLTAGAAGGMTEASLVKLDILETALYRQQLGYGFDADDATEMMEQSDNDAADDVFAADGGNDGLAHYNALIGLGSTALEPSGVWGLSTTSAADQLTLLRQLVSAGSPLNAASRQYALQLMGSVEADQRWGVSAAADPGAASRLKNGWLDIDDDGGRWAVTSAGLTTSGGHQVLLVVLSQHQPDYRTGVDRVEAAARELAAALTR
ncbi:MAG TPA: serine hydrolase [Jatrophihabitans sp.]|nr:serine hydrolase [Jatrophihabitans sp.]